MRRHRPYRSGKLCGASRGHALQHRLASRSRFSRCGAMEQHRRRLPHLGRPGLGVGSGRGAVAPARGARCRAKAGVKAGADGCVAAARDTSIDPVIFGDAAGEQAAAAPRVGSCRTERRRAERRHTELTRRTLAAHQPHRRAQHSGEMGLADGSCRRTPRRAGRRDSSIGAIGSGRACRECRPRGVHRQRSARLRQSSHHQTRRQFVVRVRS